MANVVAVVGVTTIDDCVAFFKSVGNFLDNRIGDLAGGNHDPGVARTVQLLDEFRDAVGADSAILDEVCNGSRVRVIHNCAVSVAHDATDNVGAHAPKADHSQLFW